MWTNAEAAMKGQLAGAGAATTNTRGTAIAPPPMMIAAVSSNMSLPLFSSAFQLACSSAASRTARATLSVIRVSLAHACSCRIVGGGQRDHGRKAFACEIDGVGPAADPLRIGQAVGTRNQAQRDRLAQCMTELRLGDAS